MARFSRLKVLNEIINTGLVPVFYQADVEVAMDVVEACVAGGVHAVEFTNRGDFAPEVFKELTQHFAKVKPDIIIGVGSVVDAPTAAMYIAYGSNFVVGPVFKDEVARLCNRRKVAYIPGCGSASEIANAEEFGVEIVKIFPGGSVGGPEFVKSILGPCPWTRIMPTGGVAATEESIKTWFRAGASCVGIGSKLIRKDLVAAGNWEDISCLVNQVLDWIREVRGESLFLGVDHVGLYPMEGTDAGRMGAWYKERFGFELKEGNSSFFVSSTGGGRIEIVKQAITDRCHVAVRVSNFEKALAALRSQGVEIGEPKVKPGVKTVFLKETDPAGNLVHLIWSN